MKNNRGYLRPDGRLDAVSWDIGRRISITTEGALFDANLPTGTELAKSGTTVYDSNALNQYAQIRKDGVAVAPLHDPDGNLMDDGKFTYTWDAENRLASVQPKAPAEKDKKLEFAYDYMGRRILKKVYEYGSGTWTPACDILFIHDGWNLISQIKQAPGQSPEETAFVWGLDLSGTLQEAGGIGGLIAKVDVTGNKSYGFFYDANGNIGQMLDTGNGAVKASYEYSPFGSVMKASGDMAQSLEFRFSTKYFDSETGLYDYGYRYYDPETGRWLSRDPLEEEGGINLYQFVLNNPANYIDPDGLKVYKCQRPLKPGRPGDKIPFYKKIPKFYHEYNCITLPDGLMKCDSTSPGSNWPVRMESGVPSNPNDDYYHKDACDLIDDDTDFCAENCLNKKWSEQRPNYDIGPGTDCQEYSAQTFSECVIDCQKNKKP